MKINDLLNKICSKDDVCDIDEQLESLLRYGGKLRLDINCNEPEEDATTVSLRTQLMLKRQDKVNVATSASINYEDGEIKAVEDGDDG